MKFAYRNKKKEKPVDYRLRGFWNSKNISDPVEIVSLEKGGKKEGDTLCRKCSQPIRFVKNSAGKWSPVNLDGSAHVDAWSPLRPRQVSRLPVPER